MSRSKSSHSPRPAPWCAAALLLCLPAAAALAAPPTVNGLFYGDGDDARYFPYSTSEHGSVLYAYFDVPSSRLYVALVVNQDETNDVVCSPGSNRAYTGSTGWDPPRPCNRLTDSEFASFTLECAPESPNSWEWEQGFACSTTGGTNPSDWVSDATCGASSPAGDWPPGVVSSSSFAANVNAFQSNPSPAWNLYALGNGVGNWKSPFLPAPNNNDATLVPGYPTYSAAHEWEWSMVYEWSVDLGPGGTQCGDDPIYFVTGVSHHSPAKNDDENDEFPPPEDPDDVIFSDWGDLPNDYGTDAASGGARHHLKISGPYLGADIQPELDGQPTANATGDGSEEDGVTVNVTGNWTAGSTQTIEVEVSNAPSGALLGAWFDWDGDGNVSDAGEFFSFNVVEGTNQLQITVGSGFDWRNDDLHARFRIFSDAAAAPGGSLTQTDSTGTADDGEVEDYVFTAGQLPVTLNAFASERTAAGELTVRWQTASETDNVGFELWGLVEGEWRAIGDLVPSRATNSSLPESYEVTVAAPPGLAGLQLVDYDSRGRAEPFGTFRVGGRYGEVQPVERVDWTAPRARRAARLEARGFAEVGARPEAAAAVRGEGAGVEARGGAATGGERPQWKRLAAPGAARAAAAGGTGSSSVTVQVERKAGLGKGNGNGNGNGQGNGKGGDGDGGAAGGDGGAGDGATRTIRVESGPLTHVAVTEPGVQRVTYEALRDGGLDLAGVPAARIAVTWRGEPVARWIDGRGLFGPGGAIEFVGRPPAGDDALYVDIALYQVSVDPSRARQAKSVGRGSARHVSDSYRRAESVERQVSFFPQSSTGDPWIERSLVVRGAATVTFDLPVAGPILPGDAKLVVGLGSVSDLPDLPGPDGQPLPEHEVEVWLAPPGGDFAWVVDSSLSGQQDWTIEAALPSGALEPGVNRLQLRFSTPYFFSLVVVDRYGVEYPSPYLGPTLDFAADPAARGYRLDGFAGPGVVAYAEEADGGLTRLDPRMSAAGGGWSAEIRSWDAERFWVTEEPHAPAVFTTAAPLDLLAGAADLVVIAGSAFVGTAALDDYLAQTGDLDPLVVDVEDVYNATGYGMAVPGAITDFLAARHAVAPFTHVQLVGTDCYDRMNRISSCISHLPLPTAPVGPTLFSHSHNRLVDLDGDGVGDVAVGQFSVRDETELATIVAKGEAWRTGGLAAARSALFVADAPDGTHSFLDQVERLRARLGWSDSEVLDLADHPAIATARTALKTSIDGGRTLTVFSGHSSPAVWSFRSLLTAGSVSTLANAGKPTLMVPLACETTYDVSPNANVLGHQLLYGGDRGALAVSGAVALSSLADNERMARHVLDGLDAGLTLGEAVLAGRQALGTGFQELQDNWLTQGDVTTRLAP